MSADIESNNSGTSNFMYHSVCFVLPTPNPNSTALETNGVFATGGLVSNITGPSVCH